MSIIRVGLAETKHFAQGYDAIFGKKKGKQEKSSSSRAKKTRAVKKSRKK